MLNKFIYLDHAAATPIDDDVLAAMQPYFSDNFFNPSSPYAPAVMVRRAYEEAKHQLAIAIGGQPTEIVITAGATESINLIINSVPGHIVTSEIEHHAILDTVKYRQGTLVKPDAKGRISPKKIEEAIRPDTQLVSIALANHELGTIQPIRDIAAIIKKVRMDRLAGGNTTPIYLHTDASQGAGQIELNVSRLGVDAMTLNAGKVYGPKQIGLLWFDRKLRLKPIVHGGGQENGLRSGTENVAGTIGFSVALKKAQAKRKEEAYRVTQLRNHMQKAIEKQIPDVIVSGDQKHRLPGHLHVSFAGIDAERLIFLLEAKGVLVATGSACAANSGTRSHVLEAIGLEPKVADGSLRITLGRLSNEENCKKASDLICEAVRLEKQRIAKLRNK